MLLELVSLAGIKDAQELLSIKLKGAVFKVKDGRIHYDDFTLIFPTEFDTKFHGSVGLNDSLDLVVSVPIRPDLLRKLGVSGDVERYAEMLVGTRVDIPLVGTRTKPLLDLTRVDTKKLMESVLKGEGRVGGARPDRRSARRQEGQGEGR